MRRRSSRLIAATLLATSAAHAQAPAPAPSQAQSLFEGGRALLQAGKIAEACAAFDNSEKLEPRPATLLNLASCREKNDQLATARAAFAEAGRLARTQNNDKLVTVALNHVRQLEPRVSKLTVVVPVDHAVPGLELLRNGDKLDAASWNKPMFVDGGSYTITARAPGRTPWTVTKQIQAEHDNAQIEIPTLVDPNAVVAKPPPPPAPVAVADPHIPPPVEPPAAAPAPTPPPAQVDTGTRGPSYALPIGVGIGAVAAGGVAVTLAVFASSNRSDAEQLNQTGAPNAKSTNDRASHERMAAGWIGGAAGIAAAAAVYLAIRVHGEREAAVAIAPVAGPTLTGVALSGRW